MGDAIGDPRSGKVGIELVVIARSFVGETVDLLGPAVGTSMRVDGNHVDQRPWKLPISTIRPPAGQLTAESYNVAAWPGVIQPSTSATRAIT